MYFIKGKQRAFELLMQQKPGFDRYFRKARRKGKGDHRAFGTGRTGDF